MDIFAKGLVSLEGNRYFRSFQPPHTLPAHPYRARPFLSALPGPFEQTCFANFPQGWRGLPPTQQFSAFSSLTQVRPPSGGSCLFEEPLWTLFFSIFANAVLTPLEYLFSLISDQEDVHPHSCSTTLHTCTPTHTHAAAHTTHPRCTWSLQ